MLEKLFESLDEKVFTSELKQNLETKFNEAVELKALEIAEKNIEEKVVELEEKSEEFKTILEKESQEKENELIDHIDAYLEKVVDDFMTESKEALEESIKSEKADMIIEAMEAMLTSTGVDIARIVEAKDSTDAENKLKEIEDKFNSAIDENIKLEKENAKLLKMGIISEMKEGLSVVEAEKFDRLANLVEFENNKDYVKKLDTIKESVKSSQSKIEKDNKIDEKVEKINEKVEDKDTYSFSHLI